MYRNSIHFIVSGVKNMIMILMLIAEQSWRGIFAMQGLNVKYSNFIDSAG
jgi:hypothetical protein